MIKNSKPDEIAIKVENVSKTFRLPHDKGNTIKGKVVNFWRREKGYEEQVALQDISFEVKKGEFFGIVGRNGSGKSTLLKLISGIYTPDSGNITVNGKLVPFIELGVGFNPELSGRDNVFLNGALLGFSRKEMDAMYDEIVEFAEIERFMDQKLKNYSSGMQVRLAFSIAIRAKADILVLDEVLAVGDEAFQRKCNEFFQIIKKDKTKTVILVTHGMEAVEQFCSRAIMIEDGNIKINSNNVGKVANSYSSQFIEKTETSNNEADRFGSGEMTLENITQETADKKVYISFEIVNHTQKRYKGVFVGINIRSDNIVITGNHMRFINDHRDGLVMNANQTKHITLELDNNLTKHDYTVDLSLRTEGGVMSFDNINNAIDIPLPHPNSSNYYKVLTPMRVIENNK